MDGGAGRDPGPCLPTDLVKNMLNIENAVVSHYEDGELLVGILNGIEASGIELNKLQAEHLAPVKGFHIGGRKATECRADKMALHADAHVLDVGCGIGGAARYLAAQGGRRVTGIDLTPEYIFAAAKIETPVRVIGGRNDLPGFQEAHYDETLAKWLVNVDFAYIDNAGHCPLQETPVLLATLVEAHLTPAR